MKHFLFFTLFLFVISLTAQASDNYADKILTSKEMLSATLNPSGKVVASIHNKDDKHVIQLRAVNNLSKSKLLDLNQWIEAEFHISQTIWIDNQHLAIQIGEQRRGIENLIDSQTVKRLLIISIDEATLDYSTLYSVRTKGWLVASLPEQANTFLYAKSGIYSKVYRIDVTKLAPYGKKLTKLQRIDGGQFKKSNEQAKVKGLATRWFIDKEGTVSSVIHFNKRDQIDLTSISNKKENALISTWKKDPVSEKFTGEFDKAFFPLMVGTNNHEYYCLDLDEEQKRSIYKVDFTEKTFELVYKSNNYKILNIELNEQRDEIIAVRTIHEGKVEYDYLTDASGDKQNAERFSYAAEINKSHNSDVSITYTESFSEPGQFFINQKGKAPALLGSHYIDVNGRNASQQLSTTVNVNGLDIPYILNTPATNSSKVPLIVMPHGGPIGIHDSVYFNETTQYLVANGFAVLRVNFRGSSGHSELLEESGKMAFTNLMIEDIYTATQDALKNNAVLDADHVCTYGASYGGYAALMLTIDYPGLFKCAASWAGVSDINLYLNSTKLSKKQIKWVAEHIADPEADYQQIIERSPAYNTEHINVPVFIGHGVKDTIVDIEHAYRLKIMLEKHKKPFDWYIDDESGHNFETIDKRKHFYQMLVEFLNSHI